MKLFSAAILTTAVGLMSAAPASAFDLEVVSATAEGGRGKVRITITARNNGPGAAGQTQVYVQENNSLQTAPGAAPQCSEGGSDLGGTCYFSSIAEGQTVTAIFDFTVHDDREITFTALADTRNDSNPANNSRQGTFTGQSGGDSSGGGGGSGGGSGGGGVFVTQLLLAPGAFKAAAAGPTMIALPPPPTPQRRPRLAMSAAVATSTTVTYQLSAAARTTFRVLRAFPGRKVGRACVRPTRANQSRSRCVRWLLVAGSFSHTGAAGANRFKFTGRLLGRKLAPGSYRLRAQATGGPARLAPFQIRRG